MQGCQLKQIKLSPAPRSKHTWCAHTLITPHKHKCTKQPFTTFHLFWWTQEKSDQILYHLQSRAVKEPAIANEFRGEREEESESGGEVEAGHEGEEVSHFPSCEAV